MEIHVRARSPTARRAAPDRRRRSRRGVYPTARAAGRIVAVPRDRAFSPRRGATWPASSAVRGSGVRAARVTAYDLHASALWFANRQHGGVGAVSGAAMTVGLALRANPRAPFERATSQ